MHGTGLMASPAAKPAPIVVGGFLVCRADGSLRITKKRPRLSLDEVAFPLTVSIPRTWGRVQPTSIEVALPEPPEARVTVEGAELDG
jgi:hypothetical protein